MVLGKLPVPGGKGLLHLQQVRVGVVWTFFFSQLSHLYSFSLSLGDGPI